MIRYSCLLSILASIYLLTDEARIMALKKEIEDLKKGKD